MSNCIVAQSGGPTSVINATVAGVVKGNQMNPLYDHVYGGLNGIEGILAERFVDLTDMSDEEKKKIATRELNKYRQKYNAHRAKITISDKQWTAIQSGAVHDNVLKEILRFADADQLRARATPRANNGEISDAKKRSEEHTSELQSRI